MKCETCGGTGTVEKTPTIAAWSEHGDREQEACPDCDGPDLDDMLSEHGDLEAVLDQLLGEN